jgi:hypothetical protein
MTVLGPAGPAPAPADMLCGLCGQICKRATRISCCNAQCCWGCGIRWDYSLANIIIVVVFLRFVTKSRKCWKCPSIEVTTKELLQHSELREAIRLHTLQATKELVSRAGSKQDLERALEDYLRSRRRLSLYRDYYRDYYRD